MLGTRFKRLSEHFLSEVTSIYRTLGIDFEPAWFPLFYLLDDRGVITVSEIAQQLRVTQSAASQLVKSLKDKGLLSYEKDPEDRRVRMVCLSPEGKTLQAKIAPVWSSLEESMDALLQEGDASVRLLEALSQTETLLKNNSLSEDVLDRLSKQGGTENE